MKAKINYSYLEKLNTILDCPCGCRISIESELFSMDVKKLPSHLQMHHSYLVGKLYCYRSKSSNTLENLEYANESFDNIFLISRLSKTAISNPKKYFKNAHTKLELSKLLSNKAEARSLREKAREIALLGLEKYKNASSLIWLLSELDQSINS